MKGSWRAFFLCLCTIVVVVLFTSFNSFSSLVKPGGPCEPYTDALKTLVDPNLLVIPSGNCNCTVSYTAGITLHNRPTPSMSCACTEPATSCPPPEVQIVEKEVIKEVVREVVVREGCDPVPWHADRTWHYPARFPLCSMDACFNFTRCENASELLIYTYDLPAPPRRFFSRINESKYFTDDPEKACIFLVFLDNDNPWPPHPNSLQYWNGGLNHALVIFADKWSQKGPPQDSIGNASVMASDIHETTYRAGFDISIPLPGTYHMRDMLEVKATERKYLATFRGLRYLGHSGEGTFRSWDSFRTMHNGVDVIVATSCNHPINNMNREKEPELGLHCDDDDLIHKGHSFTDLMNSTFAFVPSGIQPASYRFIEVLSAGAIPVLIADNYVKPYDTLIQWYKCLLQFPTTEMHRIVDTLRAMKKEEVLKRQENCIAIYREFLQDDETLIRASVRALKARFLGAIPSFSEIRRR